MEPEDLDLLYKIENDRQLWNVGNTNVPYSLVVENGVGDTVGLADLVNFDAKNLRAEVSIVIIDSYRRNYYGETALCQLADYASKTLHLHQLYAIVHHTNTVARHLFKKCGYKETNRLSDWLYDGTNYHDALMMQKIL